MNNTKERGITLIGLVVTIIILIILVGIGVNLFIGENGVITKSLLAKEKQEIAQYIEKIELARGTVALENEGVVTLDNLISKIYENEIVPQGNITKLDDERAEVITIEGYKFIITADHTEYIGKGEPSPIQPEIIEGTVIISSPKWGYRVASVTITKGEDADSDLIIQYQVNTIEEDKWIEGTTVQNLKHNDIVYARLWNGSIASNYASLEVIDSIAPEISVREINEKADITEKSISINVYASDAQTGLMDDITYIFYIKKESEDEYIEVQNSSLDTCNYTNLEVNILYNMKIETFDKVGNKGVYTITKMKLRKSEYTYYTEYYGNYTRNIIITGISEFATQEQKKHMIIDIAKIQNEIGGEYFNIEDSAFSNTDEIESVTFLKGDRKWGYSLGNKAFSNCKNLEKVTLVNKNYLYNNLFEGCEKLKTLTLPQKIGLNYNVFTNSFLEEIIYPYDTYGLAQGEYYGSTCGIIKHSTSIKYEIRYNSFIVTGVKENKEYVWLDETYTVNGYEYKVDEIESLSGSPEMIFFSTNSFDSYEDHYVRIYNDVFMDCEKLEEIELADYIGIPFDIDFSNLTNLRKFKGNLENIYPLTNCPNLEFLELGDRVQRIEAGVFNNNTNLMELRTSNNLRKIGSSAFENCSNLEWVELGNNVERIGENAFANCGGLRHFEISGGNTIIEESAFKNSGGGVEGTYIKDGDIEIATEYYMQLPENVSIAYNAFENFNFGNLHYNGNDSNIPWGGYASSIWPW